MFLLPASIRSRPPLSVRCACIQMEMGWDERDGPKKQLTPAWHSVKQGTKRGFVRFIAVGSAGRQSCSSPHVTHRKTHLYLSMSLRHGRRAAAA